MGSVEESGSDHFPFMAKPGEAIRAEQIYMLVGDEKKYIDHSRSIDVQKIYCGLTTWQHKLLLLVYCLTWCDTVRSFFGYEKIKAFCKRYRTIKGYLT